MPDYLISDGADMPKFARVDGSGDSVKLVFVEQSAATGFATPEEARRAADDACDSMMAAGERKAAKAMAKGDIRKGSDGFFTHVKSERWAYSAEELCVPAWLWWIKSQGRDLPISSRPSAEDVYGVFETFYVRSQKGWLSRSLKRRDEGSLVWGDSFGLAVPFSSREAAEAELARWGSGHVLKASSVFTAVSSLNAPEADDLSDGVRAACEARDIESALTQSAQERLAAMREAAGANPAEPAKRGARL